MKEAIVGKCFTENYKFKVQLLALLFMHQLCLRTALHLTRQKKIELKEKTKSEKSGNWCDKEAKKIKHNAANRFCDLICGWVAQWGPFPPSVKLTSN